MGFDTRGKCPYLIKKTYKWPFIDFLESELALNGQTWLFYAEKWIFSKNLVLCLSHLTPGICQKMCFEASQAVF